MLRLNEPFGRCESLGAQEFGVVEPRLITRAGIAEDRHDGLAWPQLAREADGAGDIDARRQAEAEAFFLEQRESDVEAFGIRDEESLVDLEAFKVGGDAALTDAFGNRAAF